MIPINCKLTFHLIFTYLSISAASVGNICPFLRQNFAKKYQFLMNQHSTMMLAEIAMMQYDQSWYNYFCRKRTTLIIVLITNIQLMAKTSSKNAKKNQPPPKSKVLDKKKKLPRGYKQCGNCRKLLHIHRYVCEDCGFKHDMKKKKKDILKNLNKITPKLLRSLIELNDFNEVQQVRQEADNIFPHSMLSKTEVVLAQDLKRRKSSKSQNKGEHGIPQLNWKNTESGSFVKMNANLVCICLVLDDILVAESIEKHGNFTQSEVTTIKAYKLQPFNKVGQIYTGKCLLHYIKNKRIYYQIAINQHVVALKAVSNRVGILTGRGTILVTDLEVRPLKNANDRPFQLHDSYEIKSSPYDQIAVFEWLKNDYTTQHVKLVAGTLMGHLYVYKIQNKTLALVRFICNAHFESITAIAQCPLSNTEECLFASGSYDGMLSVWSLNEKEAIYSTQASNRKISSLVWDSGAKFIFVIRDENQDSGVLACFFAILKSDESVTLSDQIDFRLIKSTANCKILKQSRSNKIILIDCIQTTLRTVEIEELRKKSLKRKKVKKQEEEKLFRFNFAHQSLDIEELDVDSEFKTENRLTEAILPLSVIADVCSNSGGGTDSVWGVTYDGFLFTLQAK